MLLGRVTIASLPGFNWAVTVSGGMTLASLLWYAAWAAVVACVMVSNCLRTAVAYVVMGTRVGSGMALVNVYGESVPNITRYGGQPMLLAYVVLMVSWSSGMSVSQCSNGSVTKQRLSKSSTVR